MTARSLRLSVDLTFPMPPARWPSGFHALPFDAETARGAHALLAEAYRNGFGSVGTFEDWYDALVADEEYDPTLCILCGNDKGSLAFAQVWTSGFIKDLAVAGTARRQGIGTALLLTVFEALRARGCAEAQLKVHTDNTSAMAFYHACNMTLAESDR